MSGCEDRLFAVGGGSADVGELNRLLNAIADRAMARGACVDCTAVYLASTLCNLLAACSVALGLSDEQALATLGHSLALERAYPRPGQAPS